MRIAFEFYGEKQVDRTLSRIHDDINDFTPAWEAMAEDFLSAEKAQFASSGATGSGGWSPLSPRYAAWKARRFPGQPILVRTGRLRDTLTKRPFGVERIDPKQMAIGSDVSYGLFHQQGTDRMPRRRPVELAEAMRRQMIKRAQEHAFGSLR